MFLLYFVLYIRAARFMSTEAIKIEQILLKVTLRFELRFYQLHRYASRWRQVT